MNDSIANVRSIACIGEVMIELVPDGPERAQLNVAGDTFNTAVYLRRLLPDTHSVSYVTGLGTDAFSDRIISEISDHGIDTARIERRTEKMPGLYAISTADDGERSFSYWRSDSAARTLFQDPCTVTLDTLDQFDLVYLSGITLAILPASVRARLMEKIDAFRTKGGVFAYDSNHRPGLWEDAETAKAANMAMWARTDIALPSVDDECALFEDPDADAVRRRICAAGGDFGALKRGPAGPCDLAGLLQQASYPPIKTVVDTTAAGDSFNAGVLASLVTGGDLQAAMAAGHTLASKVVQAKGAILPDDV